MISKDSESYKELVAFSVIASNKSFLQLRRHVLVKRIYVYYKTITYITLRGELLQVSFKFPYPLTCFEKM